MNQQKGFTNIVLIVLVVVIAVVGYFALVGKSPETVQQTNTSTSTQTQTTNPPTPNETANWKKFQNEKYGFEVKYPSVGWTKYPLYPPFDGPNIELVEYRADNPNVHENEILISVQDYSPYGNIEGYINSVILEQKQLYNRNLIIENSGISILQNKTYLVRGYAGADEGYFVALSNKFLLEIHSKGKDQNIRNQILSILRFTK